MHFGLVWSDRGVLWGFIPGLFGQACALKDITSLQKN